MTILILGILVLFLSACPGVLFIKRPRSLQEKVLQIQKWAASELANAGPTLRRSES